MPKRMLVHDTRLSGTAPSIAQNTYSVDGSVSTSHICEWIGSYARSQGGLDELIIMCHGFAVLEDDRAQMTWSDAVGGAGLQLGREGLNLHNVRLTQAWRPNIRKVFMYACGVAAPSIYEDPFFDGQRFCGEMAVWSGAHVYASDVLQWYHQERGSNVIDFGRWEGHVYRFSPDTGESTLVTLDAQPMTV